MLSSKDILSIVEDMNIELDDQTEEILGILCNTDIISENEIAEKLDLKINASRKALYKLHNIGFVEYTKEKDEEKKWWYIYFWNINRKRLLEVYKKFIENLLKQKRSQIISENEFSFESPSGEKFRYETALENGFVSPTTGKPIAEINNSKLIHSLETDVHNLNKKLDKVTELKKSLLEIATSKNEEEAATVKVSKK